MSGTQMVRPMNVVYGFSAIAGGNSRFSAWAAGFEMRIGSIMELAVTLGVVLCSPTGMLL